MHRLLRVANFFTESEHSYIVDWKWLSVGLEI